MILFLVRLTSERNGPETRREILNLLNQDPGLTKTQLCDRLDLAWGTVSHHVRVLEREHQLVKRRIFGFNRIYTPAMRGPEATLMPFLRDSLIPLLERIKAKPGIGIQALSRELSLGRKIIRRQLEALVDNGVLDRSNDYRPKFYIRELGRTAIRDGARHGPLHPHGQEVLDAQPEPDRTSGHLAHG